MKTGAIVAVAAVAAIVVAGAVYMIDVDQTQEAELPEVSIEGGQMPEFDAEVGTVEMGTEETTVEVPNVEVTMEEETVTVPTIDVTPPEEDADTN